LSIVVARQERGRVASAAFLIRRKSYTVLSERQAGRGV